MRIPWQRRADPHARTVDTPTAVLPRAVLLLGDGSDGMGTPRHPEHAVPRPVALGLVSCGALPLRQRARPRAGAAATAVCAAVAGARGLPVTPSSPPAGFAVHRAAVGTDGRTARRTHLAAMAPRPIGMRERAPSEGSVLRAGHRTEGGFRVATRLPLPPHAPRERTP